MKHGKRDANHAAILAALRAIPNVSVADTADLCGGFPDAVIGVKGRHHVGTYLLEIKACRKRDDLTDKEREFRNGWKGHYAVVTTIDEALIACGLAR